MTGFGQAVVDSESCRVTARVRSVNHRFLDLAVRLPETCRQHEAAIREVVASRLNRGRVEVRIDLVDYRERQVRVRFNHSFGVALRRLGEELERENLPLGSLQLGDLLRLPDALQVSIAESSEGSQSKQQVLEALDAALDQVERAREAEGKKLAVALGERLDALGAIVGQISGQRAEVERELVSRYRKRLNALVADPQVLDEARIAQEAALLVERSDVQEEIDRLSTHAAHFRELMKQSGPIGKRLDFLSQEMFREITTLATKCRDTGILQLALEAKVFCEQLREQLQNLE